MTSERTPRGPSEPAERGGPALIMAPAQGEVPELVLAELEQAKQHGQQLLVYVGASWCEPCQVFLDALKANELPPHFDDLRFLKFDHDNDESRLDEAGFGGKMIPRFVVPAPDGSATERRFEGSTKGPEAITNIVPRLEGILDAPAPASP